MNNKKRNTLLLGVLLVTLIVDVIIFWTLPDFLIPVIVFTLVGFVTEMSLRASFDTVEKKEGNLFLRPSRIYKILSVMGIVISLMLALIPFVPSITGTSNDAEYAAYAGLFLLILSLMTYGSSKKLIVANEDAITSYGLWRKPAKIDWSEVNKVNFNKVSMHLSFVGNLEKIRVPMYYVGFQDFLNLMKRKIEPVLCGESVKKIEEVYKANGL